MNLRAPPRSYSGAPDVVGYSRLMVMDELATLQAHPCEVVDPAIVVLKS
jgi:hypothetical protein